jgi:hypothetical protein
MKGLLESHIGSEIGVNIIKPLRIDAVTLVAIYEDHFTVKREDDGNTYHIPYRNIAKIIENPDGVTVGGFFKQHKTYPFVVKIGHLVEHLEV